MIPFLKSFLIFRRSRRASRRLSSQTAPQNPSDSEPRPQDQPPATVPLVSTSPPDVNAPISQTDPRDWTYIAEGGATIVFSYDGPRNLHFDGTVIRLRKSPSGSDSTPPVSSEGTRQEVQDADDPAVDFQEYVISRIVPAEFLPHLEHVQVERGWLEKMVAVHDETRPAKRRAKDGIDLKRTRAILATDLIGSQGWAVEIKVCVLTLALLSELITAHSQSGGSNLTPSSSPTLHVLSSCAYAGSA